MAFGMAFLAAEAFGFEHGNSLQANLVQGVPHFVQFEWFDNRFDFFHLANTRKQGILPFM
jgi:hypothetical protein